MASQETPPSRVDTGLPSRLAGGLTEWKELLRTEELQCAELGLGAAILSIGLRQRDALGADAAEAATRALVTGISELLQPTDRLCVLRSGEIGVLMIPVEGRLATERRTADLYRALRDGGFDVAMGWAMRRDGHGLFHAAAQADAAMLRGHPARLDLTD